MVLQGGDVHVEAPTGGIFSGFSRFENGGPTLGGELGHELPNLRLVRALLLGARSFRFRFSFGCFCLGPGDVVGGGVGQQVAGLSHSGGPVEVGLGLLDSSSASRST